MGNLLTSILNASNAFHAYDRSLAVIQNNITNASTPGYVRQEQSLVALPFQIQLGVTGGVMAGPVLSSRSEYSEEAVRREQSLLGNAEQRAADLGQVEPLFSLNGHFGIAASLNGFFNSFSQLSINPNDQVARQSAIESAGNVAQNFNQSAIGLGDVANNVDQQIRYNVDNVNRLVGQLRDLNVALRSDSESSSDAGLDAKIHNTLEDLAELANITTLRQSDGSFSVFLGGQTPLLIGEHQYEIKADFSSPVTKIRDFRENDATDMITGGKLAGLIREKDVLIPGYMNDLNQLAQTFAEQVNLQLSQGVDASGAAPGVDLFSFNNTVGAASSIAITGMTPDQLAAASPGAAGGNGNALAVVSLADAKILNGFTFTQFYGNLGGRVGRDLSTANEDQQMHQELVTQARDFRAQASSVSLDEEAAKLLQIQRAYQASGKLINVLNEMTDTLIGIVR